MTRVGYEIAVELAAAAVGAAREMSIAVAVVVLNDGGETIAIRDMVYLALSYDHRVVDGADAARFLSTMKARIEDGQFEV